MKKLSAIILSLLICIVAMFGAVGCTPDEGGGTDQSGAGNKEVDTTKTQLNLGVYNGGYGVAWARAVATEFENYYAETSFEEGKKGVQVMIDPQKTRFDYTTLIPNLQTGIETNDVYLTAASNYYRFVLDGVVEDITDTLKEKIYNDAGDLIKEGETATKSVLDLMDPYFVESYEWKDGNYYGFPFEDGLQGLIYDADLFELKDWEEPETMEDFYDLLDKMVAAKITPFTWTGANDFYYSCLTTAIVAQYEGVEGANQNLFYNGEFNGTPITPANGYLLAGQQGKLEALKFLRKITSSTDYYSKSAFDGSQSHLLAQSEFIGSVQAAKAGSARRIAMLLDGDWWENEARESFNQMASNNASYGYGKRNFKFLPMPRIEGQKSENRIVVSFSNGTIGFVNKNSGQKSLAKLWVQWMHQNSQLAKFTTSTGSCRPFTYGLTKEEKDGLTPFAKSLWDVRHDPSVTIYRTSLTSDYRKFADMNIGGPGEICSKVGTATYTNALRAFKNNKDLTAEEYFEGSKAYYNETDWKKSYDKYNG